MGACVVEILGVNYKRWNFQRRLRKLCGISKGLWFYFSLVVSKGYHSFMEFPRVKLCFLCISKGKLCYCLYSQKRNKQVTGELTLLATPSLFVPYSSMCLLQLLPCFALEIFKFKYRIFSNKHPLSFKCPSPINAQYNPKNIL